MKMFDETLWHRKARGKSKKEMPFFLQAITVFKKLILLYSKLSQIYFFASCRIYSFFTNQDIDTEANNCQMLVKCSTPPLPVINKAPAIELQGFQEVFIIISKRFCFLSNAVVALVVVLTQESVLV